MALRKLTVAEFQRFIEDNDIPSETVIYAEAVGGEGKFGAGDVELDEHGHLVIRM